MIDPITLAVIKSALDSIVDEMAYTVIRTARSEIIKDVMDYSAALCDAEGRMIAQARTIAQHLGAVPDAMQSVLAEFRDDLHPGDVVAMNDPYQGGMHIPDVFLFMPIFWEGALEASRWSSGIRPTWAAGCRASTRATPPRSTRRACACRR